MHDLAELLTLVAKLGEEVPSDILGTERLTDYAATTRYPGVYEPVTDDEYQEIIAIAERVVEWADRRVRG